MVRLTRFFRAVGWLQAAVLVVLGLILLVVVLLSVFLRYVLHEPPSWSYELSILLFIWVTFIGASLALHQGEHVKFEFITHNMPTCLREIFQIVGLVIVGLMAIAGMYYGLRVFAATSSQRFQTIPFSRGWMYASLPVGMFFMLLHSIEAILVDTHRGSK